MYSSKAKLAEVRREIAMRKNVYPRHIASGKLKQEKADEQVAIMEEIAEDYAVKVRIAEGTFPS